MPYYKHEFDPVKVLESKTRIPKAILDLPHIIAEQQARRVWPMPPQIVSEDPKILEFFRKFFEVNRFHEWLIRVEELLATFGQVIITVDKYEDGIPRLEHADPYMLSRIGKFHMEEKVASVYKYVVRDAKSYPVLEEWTDKKVKRTWYLPDKDVQVDSMKAPIEELQGRKIMGTEEKYHPLGTLPVVELRNKQKWVYELQSPWSWKPQLATWYPVRGLIEFAYHTLRQIWKNMILVKPKIIGDFYGQDMSKIINNPGDMIDVLGDMFINLKMGNVENKGANLHILQGDMQIQEWFSGFQQIIDFIFIGSGLPVLMKAEVEQTATEVATKNAGAIEAVKLLKQLRIDQLTRVLDKPLIISGLWNGEGKRPYSLSVTEEENKDKAAMMEEIRLKIENNLSNYVTEIGKLYSVNKEEAEKILQENIKVNSQVFEATKHMQQEDNENKENNKKEDKN